MERWLRMCRACGWASRLRVYTSQEHAADVPIIWRPGVLEPSYAACPNCGSNAGYEPVRDPADEKDA
ncbi:MAG TPA: hypothetical protein VFH74_03560 [Gaiellales bacterium]|nr:hypothetical protein [Gaiellales bacterium]